MAKPKEPERFGTVSWTVGDLQSLRPKWSKTKCEEWFDKNEKYIKDRLVELGWEVIESLLPTEGKDGR